MRGELRAWRADLHVHTVLSPCASYRMAPGQIVARARAVGLDLLGVVDHNSAGNAAAVVAAARGSGLAVLPGLEVETREEVHVLSLFESVDQAAALQAIVYAHLPPLPNDEAIFGAQLVVDAEDGFLGREPRRLVVATSLGLSELAASVARLGGLCVPAHVDRPANGLVAVLGLVPPEPAFLALEVSRHARPADYAASGATLLRSSDAHDLDDLGTASSLFYAAAPTLAELVLACRGEAGRRVVAPGAAAG